MAKNYQPQNIGKIQAQRRREQEDYARQVIADHKKGEARAEKIKMLKAKYPPSFVPPIGIHHVAAEIPGTVKRGVKAIGRKIRRK